MRIYCEAGRQRKTGKRGLLAIPKSEVDRNAWFEIADLAHRIGVRSDQINALRNYPRARVTSRAEDLVAESARIQDVRRCGKPNTGDYFRDKKHLFLPNLYNSGNEQTEQITPFFVRKWIFGTFFQRACPVELWQNAELIPVQEHPGTPRTRSPGN